MPSSLQQTRNKSLSSAKIAESELSFHNEREIEITSFGHEPSTSSGMESKSSISYNNGDDISKDNIAQASPSNKILEEFTSRIHAPGTYLEKLEHLQLEVFEHSAASQRYFGPEDQKRDFIMFYSNATSIPKPNFHISDEEIFELIDQIPESLVEPTLGLPETPNFPVGETLLGILDSRNVLANALRSLKM